MSKSVPGLTDGQLDRFLAEHHLEDDFRRVIQRCYLPLLAWIKSELDEQAPLVIGINGAQGTGKSTAADFLALALNASGINTAVLSIDDFYLSPLEREELAQDIHPLLQTRGVPGTHDIDELTRCIHQLKTLSSGDTAFLPRFDKAIDDRQPEENWPAIAGPVHVIVLEGWCVATQPQPQSQLRQPINQLESEQDGDGLWRRYVNRQLENNYAGAFDLLDRLIFLAAPDFESVHRWRQDQESRLAQRSKANEPGLMNSQQLQTFIQHYERLTRHNLETLPKIADVHVKFDRSHQCTDIAFRE